MGQVPCFCLCHQSGAAEQPPAANAVPHLLTDNTGQGGRPKVCFGCPLDRGSSSASAGAQDDTSRGRFDWGSPLQAADLSPLAWSWKEPPTRIKGWENGGGHREQEGGKGKSGWRAGAEVAPFASLLGAEEVRQRGGNSLQKESGISGLE